MVATIRRFVGDLCLRVLEDADVTSRVVVAAHELFDNAIRHASDGESQLHLEVRRVGVALDEGEIVLSTANAIASDRAPVLVALLEEIAANVDRGAFYQSLIKRVGHRSESPVGLGLGRIHAEAELDITGGVTEGIARVAARGRFPLRVVPR